MSLSPHEIETLAEALADRVMRRLSSHVETDAMLDNHAVAALLSCSVPTVERLTKTGEIPSHKYGRLRRYRKSEVLSRQNEKGGAE